MGVGGEKAKKHPGGRVCEGPMSVDGSVEASRPYNLLYRSVSPSSCSPLNLSARLV